MNAASLVRIASIYAAHKGLKLSTVAAYAVNDGKVLKKLADGGSCTIATGEKLLRYFEANWPADLDWPRDIQRPSATKERAA
jgi:hypothetical protein